MDAHEGLTGQQSAFVLRSADLMRSAQNRTRPTQSREDNHEKAARPFAGLFHGSKIARFSGNPSQFAAVARRDRAREPWREPGGIADHCRPAARPAPWQRWRQSGVLVLRPPAALALGCFSHRRISLRVVTVRMRQQFGIVLTTMFGIGVIDAVYGDREHAVFHFCDPAFCFQIPEMKLQMLTRAG